MNQQMKKILVHVAVFALCFFEACSDLHAREPRDTPIRDTKKLVNDVCLIAIHDRTERVIGQFPFQWSAYADVVEKLDAAGAAAVVLAVPLPPPREDDRACIQRMLEKTRCKLILTSEFGIGERGVDDPALTSLLVDRPGIARLEPVVVEGELLSVHPGEASPNLAFGVNYFVAPGSVPMAFAHQGIVVRSWQLAILECLLGPIIEVDEQNTLVFERGSIQLSADATVQVDLPLRGGIWGRPFERITTTTKSLESKVAVVMYMGSHQPIVRFPDCEVPLSDVVWQGFQEMLTLVKPRPGS